MDYYACFPSERCEACLKRHAGGVISGHISFCPHVGVPIDENGKPDWNKPMNWTFHNNAPSKTTSSRRQASLHTFRGDRQGPYVCTHTFVIVSRYLEKQK